MSETGETEYLNLRCHCVKLPPENSGFYFIPRTLPVSVKHFGNFCSKESDTTPGDDSTERKRLLWLLLGSQSGTVALTFKKQRKSDLQVVSQSDRDEAPSWLSGTVLDVGLKTHTHTALSLSVFMHRSFADL